MKKVLVPLAAAAFAIGAPAHAAVTVDDTSLENVDGPDESDGTTTISFDDSDLETPEFYEFLTFTNDVAGVYDFTLDTSSVDIDFTEAFLSNGDGMVFALSELFDNGRLEFFGLSALAMDAGTYTLNIFGDNRGQGALGGTITISQAVPEPATWMMLLLGFFGMGLALRKSKAATTQSLSRSVHA